MLRKAVMGAAAAGAATLFALGTASPAMAESSDYDFNQNDFGGVNFLSNFCVNVSDVNVIQLIDLLTSGNASCDFDDSNLWVNGGGKDKHDH